MERSVQVATTVPDESTLRAWDDMHTEVLHELQDGAEIPDGLMDITSQLAAMLNAWWPRQGILSLKPLSLV